ncbi:MAG: hypothetical protein IJR49_03465 [Treponema sp.]|nr:hypothetical protein [Treponema sp.]
MRQFFSLFPLFKQVVTDWRVIVTAIVAFLVIDFGIFVATYRPRPTKKKKKVIVAEEPPKTEDNEEEERENLSSLR